MSSNVKKTIMMSALTMVVALIYTICVKFVDVAAIGPMGSSVGFASLNSKAVALFGFNEYCYDMSKSILVFAFIFVGLFGLFGLIQIISRKGIWKADQSLYVLYVTYALSAIVYLIFEVVIINCRPILEDGELEASFPSTHTMLSIVIFVTSALAFERIIVDKKMRALAKILCYVLACAATILRFMSGVHWLTDIIGGIIYAVLIVTIYMTLMSILNEKILAKKAEYKKE